VLTRVNEIEAMYERSRVNGKVERGSTFTLTRDLPYIVFILFTRVNFTCVRTSNIRDSGNHLNFLKPPSLTPLAKREMILKQENEKWEHNVTYPHPISNFITNFPFSHSSFPRSRFPFPFLLLVTSPKDVEIVVRPEFFFTYHIPAIQIRLLQRTLIRFT